MTKSADSLTARESVWAYRIRQKIALERIVLAVGNPREKYRAMQFLQAMEDACPELLEDFEQYDFEFLDLPAPELFDEDEYSTAKGRKTALKLPRDVVWEEKIINRAAREYADLFHPCTKTFDNAMIGLQYLSNLHPELFARARARAIEQRGQILTSEIYCPCGCTTPENRQPADSFRIAERGRFENVSKRIAHARQAMADAGDDQQGDGQFFLDRIREIAPEMLAG